MNQPPQPVTRNSPTGSSRSRSSVSTSTPNSPTSTSNGPAPIGFFTGPGQQVPPSPLSTPPPYPTSNSEGFPQFPQFYQQNPSTSSVNHCAGSRHIFTNFESIFAKDINKLKKVMKKNPFHKQKDPLFKPSSTPSAPLHTMGPSSASPSFVPPTPPPRRPDDISTLRPIGFVTGATSAPGLATRGGSMSMGTAASSSSYGTLNIDTFGGETAGSGLDYLTDPAYEEDDATETVRREQDIAMNLLRAKLRDSTDMLIRARIDEQMVDEFIAQSYHDEFKSAINRNVLTNLESEVRALEEEIVNFSKEFPGSVKRPARPPTPTTIWHCARCAEQNSASDYRCHCGFPRPAIDPREYRSCGCKYCTQAFGASSGELFLSLSPCEDDWTLINKLGYVPKD